MIGMSRRPRSSDHRHGDALPLSHYLAAMFVFTLGADARTSGSHFPIRSSPETAVIALTFSSPSSPPAPLSSAWSRFLIPARLMNATCHLSSSR